jgi:hypothetical protein
MFQLCREFGWTPRQLYDQDAKTISKFILILNELEAMQRHRAARDDDETTILIEDDD